MQFLGKKMSSKCFTVNSMPASCWESRRLKNTFLIKVVHVGEKFEGSFLLIPPHQFNPPQLSGQMKLSLN